MLFGEKYDLSLGYILRIKGNCRDKTIDFIKELPEEFIENIRQIYGEGLETNHGIFDITNSEKRKRSFFELYSKDKPDISYKFYIMCKELCIVKSKIVNEAKVDIFSLSLKPLEVEDIKNMREGTEIHLGSVSIGEYCKFNFKEMEYDLKKTKDGYGIKRTYSFLSSTIKMRTKKFEDSNIQEEAIESKKLFYNLRK